MDLVYNVLSNKINIDDDRRTYTAIYDEVKKVIIHNGLRKDKHFNKMFVGEKLCGSYADRLKISKPNEFDLVMRLQLPHNDLVKISSDENNKGNVRIDISEVLEKLKTAASPNDQEMFKFLKYLTNDEHFLITCKIQAWLERCMTRVLNEIKLKFEHNSKEYNLKYRKQGPAHTIEVQNVCDNEIFAFSVDFVPGFLFGIDKSVSFRTATKCWEAVPKPIKDKPTKDSTLRDIDKRSFRPSYMDSEREIISGKCQMKNAIRLMKKFRDANPKMVHLKSYHIKTLFLWHNEGIDEKYWNKSIHKIMREMFQKLEDSLLQQEIKYFWDSDLNMLQHYKPSQIKEMYMEVKRTREILLEPINQKNILKCFLTRDELERLSLEDMKMISDSMVKPNSKYGFYMTIVAYCGILGFQIYRIVRESAYSK